MTVPKTAVKAFLSDILRIVRLMPQFQNAKTSVIDTFIDTFVTLLFCSTKRGDPDYEVNQRISW